MSAVPAPTLQPQQPAPLSQLERIMNVFIAPAKAFADMKTNASWWAPFLIIAAVSISFAYAVDTRIGYDKVLDNTIRMQPKAQARLEQMQPAQREATLEKQAKGYRILSYAYPAVILLQFTIISALMLATFKFGAGADITFKTAFAIVIYAGLANMVRWLLAIVALFAGFSPDGFLLENPLGTNPGFYMDAASSPTLYRLATALDIFMIWTLAITAIGFSAVSKVKRSTSMAIVFGWYAFFILLFTGIGKAFS